jgi:site-specific recombinase
MNLKDNREKADAALKDLHLTLVTKKPALNAKIFPPKKNKNKKGKKANTKEVESTLEKMEV